jgi:hypothetical protein
MIVSIESITITDIISSVAAIAALITAYVTYLTVKEIKKQREHSYHPDINVSNFGFFLYRCEDADEENPEALYLYYSKRKLETTEPKTGYNDLKIDIHNIGFGVAKLVTYDWKFDFERAKEELQRVNKSCEFEIGDDYISVDFKEFDISWTYDTNEENQCDFINFILPYSVENRNNEIKIPSYFVDLFYLYMTAGTVNDEYYDQDDFPPLQLSMNYRNIHGKKVKKEFQLYLKFDFFASPINCRSDIAKFKFEILEKI